MSGVNIPLLRKAVEWVEAEAEKPEIDRRWNQRGYCVRADGMAYYVSSGTPYTEADVAPYCGTAFCVAGYVGQMLDARYATTSEVEGVHVADFARDALGLSEEEASNLFYAYNSADDVRRIAENHAGEKL